MCEEGVQVESETERADAEWMTENLYRFAPLARDGFQVKGRGAIVANLAELVLRLHYEEGHPFNYQPAYDAWLETAKEFMEPSERVSLAAWFEGYNPDTEILILLYKFERVSPYRVALPSPEDLDDEIRGAYVYAEQDERQRRLTCSDFWARDFRLASPYLPFWKDRLDL